MQLPGCRFAITTKAVFESNCGFADGFVTKETQYWKWKINLVVIWSCWTREREISLTGINKNKNILSTYISFPFLFSSLFLLYSLLFLFLFSLKQNNEKLFSFCFFTKLNEEFSSEMAICPTTRFARGNWVFLVCTFVCVFW